MEVAGFVGILIIVGIAVVAVIIVGLILLLFARSWIKVARADEALVISGRKQKVQSTVLDADGSSRSELSESPVTVIVNGKSLVNPITQRHEIISLRSRQVMLNAEAQSLDNVTLNVDGVAIVKIGSDPLFVRRAAERFASQDAAIEQFTTEQLEGALRGIVATLSVVELMRERKKFSDQIAADVSHELAEQGLILDSFQIKGITDSVGYIQSLGSPEIQAKRQAAEIAQTNADRAINQKNIANDEANLIEQTALDTNTANAAAGVGRARAEAEQAEQLARAKAEQAVLQQQAENKQAQLDADVKRAVIGYPVVFAGVEDAQDEHEFQTLQKLALTRLQKAARSAGFKKIEFLNEPTAALKHHDDLVEGSDEGKQRTRDHTRSNQWHDHLEEGVGRVRAQTGGGTGQAMIKADQGRRHGNDHEWRPERSVSEDQPDHSL